MEPLTRKNMDNAACQVPGCSHEDHRYLYLTQACHPRAGTEALYDKVTGVLRISCYQCKRFVAELAIAAEPLP